MAVQNYLGVALIFVLTGFVPATKPDDSRFINYVVDPAKSNISFYWKDAEGRIFGSIESIKLFVEKDNKQLLFAMNGGMYMTDNSPLGLYIEHGKERSKLNTRSATGNFYLKPNGVFYLTNNGKAVVCQTEQFKNRQIKFATQSGPMLVVDGKLHPAFKQGSTNLFIRNGVGVLPDGKIMFAISTVPVNFYDFAMYFKEHNCTNALYLDGFVSRMYLPEKNVKQLDGNFGVIIGVIK
jgi:uncharacterized protein YigE (DUF2233 family)